MTDTEKRMVAIIRDLFGEVVTDLDGPLTTGPQLDSLDMVELVMSVEEQFGVEIPDDEAEPFMSVDAGKTVREWCSLVDAKLAPQVPA